jgi:hypothetical protein
VVLEWMEYRPPTSPPPTRIFLNPVLASPSISNSVPNRQVPSFTCKTVCWDIDSWINWLPVRVP